MVWLSSFYIRHRWLILLVAIALLPLAIHGARTALANNTNDVREWLPQEYGETADYRWFRQSFGNDEFVVISWPGCHADDPRLDLVAKRLVPAASEPVDDNRRALFQRIITGPQLLQRLTDPPISLSPEQAVHRLRGTLYGPDGRQTCAILTMHDESKRHLRRSIATLRRIIVEECGVADDELKLGGPPTVNAALDAASNKSLLELAGLSGVVGLLIAWRCFRTWRLTLIVFFVGAYSALASLGVVGYTTVAMNAILITMAPLVYVAATSGAIHLANYYRDSVRDRGIAGAAGRAVAHAFVPLALATTTTAAGLISLCYSELLPIRMFGLFSAIGVVLSGLLLFFVLPALLEVGKPGTGRSPKGRDNQGETVAASQFVVPPLGGDVLRVPTRSLPPEGGTTNKVTGQVGQPFQADCQAGKPDLHVAGEMTSTSETATTSLHVEGEDQLSPAWHRFAMLVIGKSHWMTTAGLAALLVAGLGLLQVETSINILRFFSRKSDIVQTYAWMETNLGKLVPMELVIRLDDRTCQLDLLERMELVSQVERRLRQLPEVGSALSAVTFAAELPPHKDWPLPAEFTTRRAVTKTRLEKNYDGLLKTGYLVRGEGEELWRISVRVSARRGLNMGQVIQRLKEVVEPVLQLQREQSPNGIAALYTGLIPIIYKAQQSLLDGLIFGFGTDLALIVIAIALLMRHWSPGAMLLLTSLFPTTLIFGVMGWTGIVVDVGTVMTPCVALGVTVDDVVHFLLWFKRGIERGMDRRQAVMLAYQGCVRAMYQSWGVIGLGLSMFAFSTFTPTMRFGAMMVTLLTVGLIGNLVFLPALLSGPLGRYLETSIRKRMSRSARFNTTQASPASESETPEPAVASVTPRRRSVKS